MSLQLLPLLTTRTLAATFPLDPTWLLAMAVVLAFGAAGWCLRRLGGRWGEAQASEQRYRDICEHLAEGCFEMSPDGGFTRANAALARILGRAGVADVLQLTAAQVQEILGAPAKPASAATAAEPVARELQVRRPDGTVAWIRERRWAVRDAAGELLHWRGLVSDITEQRQAAAELATSRERYRMLFDHLPIGIIEYDYRPIAAWFEQLRATGVKDLGMWLQTNAETLREAADRIAVVDANAATMRLFGLRDRHAGLAQLGGISTSDVYEARRKTFIALWEGRTEADGEFAVSTIDGRLLRMSYHWRVPVIDGQPNYERTQLALVDFTEAKSAEQALAAERERLSVTLRAMSEAVVTIDQAGIVQFMNEAAADLTGWPAGAAVGHALREVCVFGLDKEGQTMTAPLAAALATGRPADLPPYTVLRPRQGPPRSVEGRCAPVHDIKGHAIGAVLVLRDITQRSRLEADLLRASKMESIGVLAGGIAHDFNNLLSIVMGSLSLALLDERAKAAAGKWLREAERATLRARDLTQQLLTFAKGGEPVRAAVPLEDVVREAAQFALHGASVRCEFAIAPDLRPADADKGQIGQVVQNLVLNAVQAMPTGGSIHLTLCNQRLSAGDVATLPAGNYLRLEIADSGRGIAPEHLARIFEPFFTTKESGSGLGLATVYSVIQKHRGHIAVESTVGTGTTFRIWLPAARVEPVAAAPVASPFEPIKGRVLFMDDEEPIRVMTQALLERLGMEVTLTSDGAEAVREFAAARAEGRPFDVVIFDLTVPGAMGGADAMREILKLDARAKGIVSSGYSSDPVMANFRAHGFRGSVPKPYRIAEFSRTLREVLTSS